MEDVKTTKTLDQGDIRKIIEDYFRLNRQTVKGLSYDIFETTDYYDRPTGRGVRIVVEVEDIVGKPET